MRDSISRIGYIDVMKGIAILCVVAGHYMFIPYIPIIIWSFHMPLFIFLNGFFFKDGKILPRITKAANAYLKPYFIVWMILMLVEIGLAYINNEDVGIAAISRFKSGIWALASNRTLYKPDDVIKIGAIWFLNALFMGSVFFAITLKIRNRIGQAIIIFLLLVVGIIQTSKFCVPLGINYGIAFLVWLWIGYQYSYLKKDNHRVISLIEGRCGFAICSIMWVAIVFIEGVTNSRFNICWLRFPLWGLELLGAFCGIITIMHISKYFEARTKQCARILRYVGSISLWILCVHAIDIEIFSKIFPSVGIPAPICFIVRFVVDITLAVGLHRIYYLASKKRLSSE